MMGTAWKAALYCIFFINKSSKFYGKEPFFNCVIKNFKAPNVQLQDSLLCLVEHSRSGYIWVPCVRCWKYMDFSTTSCTLHTLRGFSLNFLYFPEKHDSGRSFTAYVDVVKRLIGISDKYKSLLHNYLKAIIIFPIRTRNKINLHVEYTCKLPVLFFELSVHGLQFQLE